MNNQLTDVEREFESALDHVRRLVTSYDEALWRQRPASGGWSAAECVAHLNLTSEACLPSMDEGLTDARARGPDSTTRRFRRDPMGWLLWKGSQPNPRMKIKTGAPFVPTGDHPRDLLIADFERLQREQLALLRAADGLPIDRVKVKSAFIERIRYSLYSVFTILSIHQHRHLTQAERALEAVRSSAS